MDATRKKYIDSIENAVVLATMGTNLFPSVMLAQAALEGGNGKSVLATKANNHFGIKAHAGWKGDTISLPTTEYINGVTKKVTAKFRSYGSLLAGFADRIDFLKSNPRYAKNGVFSAATPEGQAKALQKAGYATDPKYSEKLISIIKTYNLKQYDDKAVKKKVAGLS